MTAAIVGAILGVTVGFAVAFGFTLWVLDQLVDCCGPVW